MGVRVVTDSVSNIPQADRDRLNIEVVSLYIVDEGVSIREVDIDYDDFYSRLHDMSTLPTSAQPSPEDMRVTFERLIAEGHEVIGVFIGSKMSGTFSSASLARDMVLKANPDARIELVDSGSNSMQEGYTALAAAEVAAAGGTIEEAVQAAEESRRHIRFLFTPETLEYLRRGGRIGAAAALVGSLLKMNPVLTVENGVADTFAKVRTYKKAMDTIFETAMKDIEQYGGLKNMCVHSIAQLELATEFRDRLSAALGNIEIPVISLSPVVGMHVGPAVGVIYETVDPLRA